MQRAALSRIALIACVSATPAIAQLRPGELIIVGYSGSYTCVMHSYFLGVGVTPLTVQGLGYPCYAIESACYDPVTNGLFVGAAGGVYTVSVSGTTATATLLCLTPDRAWSLFIGHNGRPVAFKPGSRWFIRECSAGGAVPFIPAAPWTTIFAFSYDDRTRRYYAMTEDGSGSAIYVIDPASWSFTRIPSPVSVRDVTEISADGNGGVYLVEDTSVTNFSEGLWHVDSAGNGVLLIGRGRDSICGIGKSLTCQHKFYSWPCGTYSSGRAPMDDVDVLDAFLPGFFPLLTGLPNFGGPTGITDVVEVPGGAQGSALTYGSGCVDSQNVPLTLTSDGCHEGGLSSGLHLTTGAAGPVFFAIGSSNTSWFGLSLPFALAGWGGGSCTLLAGDDIFLGPLFNGGSGVSMSFRIPRDPLFTGAQVFAQGLMLDFPPGNTLGIVTSNGVQITIG